MSRPTLEVADIVRAAGDSFWDKHKSHFAWVHRKVLDAIIRCRTAALGGHRDTCTRCGHQAISFNSCRNRHCPKCQGNARAKWLAARSAELLPVPYFHIVFTLPHQLCSLILQNKRLLYDLLFRTSAASLLELARDPKHLGADIGFLGVLHTWGQVGIELGRASCRWGVTILALSIARRVHIPTMTTFTEAPLQSRKVEFLDSGFRLGFPREAFPRRAKLKRSLAFTPTHSGLPLDSSL